MGGVGKTQIALRYVAQEASRYQVVFWMDASTDNSLTSVFLECAQRLIDWTARVRRSAVNFTRIGYEFGLGQFVNPASGEIQLQQNARRLAVDAVCR